MYSRRAVESVGGFDAMLRGYEDDDILLRLFLAGWENIYRHECHVSIRNVPGSSGRQPSMAASMVRFAEKWMSHSGHHRLGSPNPMLSGVVSHVA